MKNKKRFLKIVSALIIAVFMVATLASCATGSTSSVAKDADGTHGALSWVYKKDGQTLTISGTGEMTSFESNEDIAWGEIATSVKKLVIEEGVTAVGDYAFFGMIALEEVELPSSLVSVGKLSFAFTSALKSVEIPVSVTSLGYGAFEASGLVSVTLPAGINTIEANTFMYCDALTSVTGNGVTVVGDKAFAYCSALSVLKLSDGNPTVSDSAFLETSLAKENVLAVDNKVTVTYNFVDADNTETVIGTFSESREMGETYEYVPQSIEGYEAVSASVTVVVENSNKVVNVSYKKIEETVESEEITEAQTEAEVAPEDDTLEPMTIVALVLTVLIIIGIIIGTVVFIRKDKKNSVSRTVRKNTDAKKDKKKK